MKQKRVKQTPRQTNNTSNKHHVKQTSRQTNNTSNKQHVNQAKNQKKGQLLNKSSMKTAHQSQKNRNTQLNGPQMTGHNVCCLDTFDFLVFLLSQILFEQNS